MMWTRKEIYQQHKYLFMRWTCVLNWVGQYLYPIIVLTLTKTQYDWMNNPFIVEHKDNIVFTLFKHIMFVKIYGIDATCTCTIKKVQQAASTLNAKWHNNTTSSKCIYHKHCKVKILNFFLVIMNACLSYKLQQKSIIKKNVLDIEAVYLKIIMYL